jgi:hypothetical protein
LIGQGVALKGLFRQDLERDPAYARGCPSEAFVNDLIGNPNGLKDLSPLVGLEGGDTHFGHDFGNPTFHGVSVVLKERKKWTLDSNERINRYLK